MVDLLGALPTQLGAITIANEDVEVVVLANKGADIYALVDRRTGVDVLFKSPWGARTPSLWSETSTSLERWISSYAGGWQLLVPNGGDECEERGVTWGFHGEAAMVPWDVLERSDDAVTLETSLVTAPLRIRRELRLDGPVLRVTERVTNLSTETTEFMWSHHPAFGAPFLDGTCFLSVGCRTVQSDDQAPGTLLSPASTHEWPIVTSADGEEVDLRSIPDPSEPRSVLAYLKDFSAGFFAITNPTLGLGVAIRWPLEVFDKAWLWQEIHSGEGWPWFRRAYVVAVEPASSIPGRGIQSARELNEPLVVLAANESREVVLEAVLFEGSTAVEGVAEGGVVKFTAP